MLAIQDYRLSSWTILVLDTKHCQQDWTTFFPSDCKFPQQKESFTLSFTAQFHDPLLSPTAQTPVCLDSFHGGVPVHILRYLSWPAHHSTQMFSFCRCVLQGTSLYLLNFSVFEVSMLLDFDTEPKWNDALLPVAPPLCLSRLVHLVKMSPKMFLISLATFIAKWNDNWKNFHLGLGKVMEVSFS